MAITLDRPVDRARPARTNRPGNPSDSPLRQALAGSACPSSFSASCWSASSPSVPCSGSRRTTAGRGGGPRLARQCRRRDRPRPTSGLPRLLSGTASPPWRGRRGSSSSAGPRRPALPAATVLVPGLVVDEPVLAAGRSARRSEARPTAPTRPAAFDRATPSPSCGRPGPRVARAPPSRANASVWDVTDLADEAGVLVVLRLSEPDAAAVSAVADQVRVVRVVR